MNTKVNRMKRLLIFHRTIAPYRIDFFNDLYEAFETKVCLQYKNLMSQKFDYDKILAQLKFAPIYLPVLVRRKGRILSKGYWKYLDKHNPDMVIVSEFDPGCIMTLLHRWIRRRSYKIVSICDDSYNMAAENNDFSKLHKWLRRIVVPHLDNLILIDPKVTEWYQTNYGKGIFFPIIKNDDKARSDYERLLPMSSETKQRFGVEGKYVFLFVGRLVAIKNVEMAIRAFSKLSEKEAAFVIIGDGVEREKLEATNKETNAGALFLGRLEGDELLKWYNIADCLILPSIQEPFGAVTNEALLAGCKALVSKKTGSRCLVKNGVNGYTFDPTNVVELTIRMRQMIEDDEACHNRFLRPSQMLITYKEYMEKLIKAIKRNRICV